MKPGGWRGARPLPMAQAITLPTAPTRRSTQAVPAPASAALDPCGVDLYADDVNGNPDTPAYAASGSPWTFLGLKATEGTYYNGAAWFTKQWGAARASSRYGVDFLRLAYAYLRADYNAIAQADYFLEFMDTNGWDPAGDIVPVADFESAEQPAGVTAQQVIDVLSAYAERIKAVLGCAPMRYTGSLFRDLGIVEPCGCPFLWVADYGPELNPAEYTDQGYTLADTWAWQFRGTSPQAAGPKGYPMTAPIGPGGAEAAVDTNVIIINGGGNPAAQLSWTKANLLIPAQQAARLRAR